jgi:hypothetical protein
MRRHVLLVTVALTLAAASVVQGYVPVETSESYDGGGGGGGGDGDEGGERRFGGPAAFFNAVRAPVAMLWNQFRTMFPRLFRRREVIIENDLLANHLGTSQVCGRRFFFFFFFFLF